jgi:uncharacterized membrane protein YtjA (UPF0391 family)
MPAGVQPRRLFFFSWFRNSNWENQMLRAAILCLVIALIAGALGLVGTEIVAANVAWILFVVFIILAVVSFVFGRSGRQME